MNGWICPSCDLEQEQNWGLCTFCDTGYYYDDSLTIRHKVKRKKKPRNIVVDNQVNNTVNDEPDYDILPF